MTGGRLIRDDVVDQIIETWARPLPDFFPRLARLKLTRRQKLVGRIRLYRWRVSEAIDMLLGRHECERD